MTTKQRKDEPQVTKVKVTMTNAVAYEADDGSVMTRVMQAIDFVDTARPGLLDAYVEDARRRWQVVQVGDEPDAGPRGYEGPTVIPFGTMSPKLDQRGRVVDMEWHEFPHELAGSYFPATDKGVKDDPEPEAFAHPLTGAHPRTVHLEG